MKNDNEYKEERQMPILHVLGSVLAALFGVQKSSLAQRDFTQGKLSTFVLVGIGMVTVIIILMAIVASYVAKVAH